MGGSTNPMAQLTLHSPTMGDSTDGREQSGQMAGCLVVRVICLTHVSLHCYTLAGPVVLLHHPSRVPDRQQQFCVHNECVVV